MTAPGRGCPHQSLNSILMKLSKWPRRVYAVRACPKERRPQGTCLSLQVGRYQPGDGILSLVSAPHGGSPDVGPSQTRAPFRPCKGLAVPAWVTSGALMQGPPRIRAEAGAAHQRRGATALPGGSRGCLSAPAPAFWPCGTCTYHARTQRSECSMTPLSSSP